MGNLTFLGNLAINTSFSGPGLTWNGGSGALGQDHCTTGTTVHGTTYSDGSVVTFGDVSSGTSTIAVSHGFAPGGMNVNNATAGDGLRVLRRSDRRDRRAYLQSGNAGFVSLSGTNTYTGGTQVPAGP